MALSDQMVRHVATLARIRVDSRDEARIGAELTRVLEYVAILERVDTTAVDPMWQSVDATWNGQRADEPQPSLERAQALANAPRQQDAMFVIPRILGEEEG